MSQQDLADAMGYKTRSTIAKIESGENDVSQKKLQKFAAVLDTSVEALISGYASSHPSSQSVTTLPLSEHKRHKNIVILLAGSAGGIVGMLLAIPSYTVLRVFAKEFFSQYSLVKNLTKDI